MNPYLAVALWCVALFALSWIFVHLAKGKGGGYF